MQKSSLSSRHYTLDYGRKNRDRPGGHFPTPVLDQGWKEFLAPEERKYAKRFHAKGIRRANKLLISEELMMFWEEITEEQILYEENCWGEYDYEYYYSDDYEDDYDYYDYYDHDIY